MTTPTAAPATTLRTIAARFEAAGLPFSYLLDKASLIDSLIAEGKVNRVHANLVNTCAGLNVLAELEEFTNPGSAAAQVRAEAAALASLDEIAMKPFAEPDPVRVSPCSGRYSNSLRPDGGRWSSRMRTWY